MRSMLYCLSRAKTPVPMPSLNNSDRVELDTVLRDWVRSLQEHAVQAVAVLGPDPFGAREDREVIAVHPVAVMTAARALAHSPDFGVTWRDSDAPLVAWQSLVRGEGGDGCGRGSGCTRP